MLKYIGCSISFVTIKVYDVLGNEIATLVNEEKPIGNCEVELLQQVFHVESTFTIY